ncbi:MAG TPA: heavy-metal-associated domain-containing protein [Azospirillaceae bacterium]|nr:heavy-metal-associated domain-containing protein [Azospirillaceae bacterium]
MTNTYKVEGMTCGGCARSVSNAIVKAAPTATVDVDLANKLVKVDGGVPEAQVKEAVEKAGFDFMGPA